MAEKKKTESEAKKVYAEKKIKHEQELEKHRAAELEYNLVSEDYNRANDRIRNARSAQEKSGWAIHDAANAATAAFIELSRIQIETRGNAGR